MSFYFLMVLRLILNLSDNIDLEINEFHIFLLFIFIIWFIQKLIR